MQRQGSKKQYLLYFNVTEPSPPPRLHFRTVYMDILLYKWAILDYWTKRVGYLWKPPCVAYYTNM